MVVVRSFEIGDIESIHRTESREVEDSTYTYVPPWFISTPWLMIPDWGCYLLLIFSRISNSRFWKR